MKGISASLVVFTLVLGGCAAEAGDAAETTDQDRAAVTITAVSQVEQQPGISATITVAQLTNPLDRPVSVTHSGHPSHAPPDGTTAAENNGEP